MKKVWNVYECEDGTKIEVKPGSQNDIILREHKNDYTFLYQITEEIEEPKKEEEKVAKMETVSVDQYLGLKRIIITATTSDNAYDFKLYYKIKE